MIIVIKPTGDWDKALTPIAKRTIIIKLSNFISFI